MPSGVCVGAARAGPVVFSRVSLSVVSLEFAPSMARAPLTVTLLTACVPGEKHDHTHTRVSTH